LEIVRRDRQTRCGRGRRRDREVQLSGRSRQRSTASVTGVIAGKDKPEINVDLNPSRWRTASTWTFSMSRCPSHRLPAAPTRCASPMPPANRLPNPGGWWWTQAAAAHSWRQSAPKPKHPSTHRKAASLLVSQPV